MKKLLLMAVCSLVLFTGCKGKSQPAQEKDNAKTEQSSVPRPDNEAIAQMVKNMYADIAKACSDPSASMSETPNYDEKYGSTDWKNTVKAVVEHDSKKDEIGFFEADPWIMGQDAGDFFASDIEVGEVDEHNGTPVTLNLHNMGNVTKVRVIVVMDNGEWKVDNLIDLTNNFDWKKSMKEYLNS
ncbi:MAG: DUF3828 domain-containing protein [Prevotella sp.]|nr:DUF3828 domain-containing protein [Prevotella sp.]